MITIINERPLSEVQAEAEQREMEKSINQMILETLTQIGEEMASLAERVKKLEEK